jgi:hypothetical protein
MAGAYTAENLATALRKSIAFCEDKYCVENLPKPKSAEDEDQEEEEEEMPEEGYTSSGACLLVRLKRIRVRIVMMSTNDEY